MMTRGETRSSDQTRFTRRSLLFGGVQAAGFALIGWRLFQLQVIERDRYGPLADENRINVLILPPRRGRLLDRFGRPIADNEDLFRATVTPALVKNLPAVLARLKEILPLTDEGIATIIARSKKRARNVPTVVASDLSFEQIARLNLFAPSLPGVGTETSWRRRYHGADAISHVAGFVGSVEKFDPNDDAILRLPDMRIGKKGAEAGFESELRGAGGTAKIEVDARGHIMRHLETSEPKNGRDVRLSIDLDLQQAIAARMAQDGKSAAVVIDVGTGEIAASVSVPGFDPGRIANGIRASEWREIRDGEGNPLLNRVVSALYSPGGTFEPVTALAALQAGVVTPTERFKCTGHADYDGRRYVCSRASGHGALTVSEALRSSCDLFFLEMARRAGVDALAAAARKLGLGAVYEFGLTDEKAGRILAKNTMPIQPGEQGARETALLLGMGRGSVLATPLQLALMTARIASGNNVFPSIRSESEPRSGSRAPFPFSVEHLSIVRAGMIAAGTAAGGTALGVQLGKGRPLVAAKTGETATETAESGASSVGAEARRTDAPFVAFVPAESPRYAIATVVERVGGAQESAMLLARDVLNLLLDRNARIQTNTDPLQRNDAKDRGNSGTAG
ncbi:penicillin-binding protein 2 [Hyphomicrobium methylovorum]|uniref:penicillin-binding protein 2 n=1 Tax=Hyphomicrobium methylovorum TaxID=84 RepID=UPI0015E63776|nr:penicillin-binding protein 2 [Hyphomicrobium methylovorum]MBA2127368.1 penicillin-binding protein 2 [Hyphomicrobium methylovorum]